MHRNYLYYIFGISRALTANKNIENINEYISYYGNLLCYSNLLSKA